MFLWSSIYVWHGINTTRLPKQEEAVERKKKSQKKGWSDTLERQTNPASLMLLTFSSFYVEQSSDNKHVCYTSLTAASCHITTNALRQISFPPTVTDKLLLSLISTLRQNQTYAFDPLLLGY